MFSHMKMLLPHSKNPKKKKKNVGSKYAWYYVHMFIQILSMYILFSYPIHI